MKKAMLITLTMLALVAILMALPRNMVVVEIGTGTWCPYCPGAAMGADDLVSNGHPVAVIKNHNGDPYANVYSNARNTYYGITSFPTAMFDGGNPSVGGSNTQSLYPSYLPKVNQRMGIASRYSLTASGVMNGNNFDINVEVAKPEADTNTNVVLHAVLTESEIYVNWQGQNHLNNVVRLMVPNQNGTPVTLGTGESTTIPLSFTWNTAWSLAHGELVIFLQNNTTKEILQANKYTLPGLVGAYPLSHTEIEFPDTYITGSQTIPITIYNFVSATAAGTISINNPAYTVSNPNFSIPGFQSATVNVIFTPTAAQMYSANMTINSNLNQHNQIILPVSGLGFLNTAPVVSDIYISGPPVVYQDLSASYAYSDADGDNEGETMFQWMRMINNTPNPIANATSAVYRTVEEDMGWQLAVQITPKDSHGMPGSPVLSTNTAPIEELPPPQNLTGELLPPDTVVLNWERPQHFGGRAFIGYRVYRNNLVIQSIANPNTTTFTDTYVPTGWNEYWVCSLFSNPMSVSIPSNVVTIGVGVSNDDLVQPINQSLSVYPNPFSANAVFSVRSKANLPVQIDIFNLKGQLVKNIKSNTDAHGQVELNWNGSDQNGSPVNTGMYLYRVKLDSKPITGKILYQN